MNVRRRSAGFAFALLAFLASTHAAAAVSKSVSPLPASAVADILKVTVYPNEGNLDELHPLDLTVHAQNPSRWAIEVDNVALLSPKAYVSVSNTVKPVRIAPNDSGDLSVSLQTKAAIPGTYALVLGVCARYYNANTPCRPAFALGKITIGVPGVADAMQYLGIPSLFLLPGALIMIMFAALYGWLTRRPAIDVKQPIILVWAVGLSFAVLPIYEVLTRLWTKQSRNYLQSYSLEDLMSLWAFSIVAAAAAAGMAAAIYRLREKRYQPHDTDTQIDVFRKLLWHRVRHDGGECHFKLAAVQQRPAAGSSSHVMFALAFGRTEPGKIWIVPGITVDVAAETKEAQDCVARIQESLIKVDNRDHASSEDDVLARRVEDGFSASLIKLGWDDGETSGPRTVTNIDYLSAGDKAVVLRTL